MNEKRPEELMAMMCGSTVADNVSTSWMDSHKPGQNTWKDFFSSGNRTWTVNDLTEGYVFFILPMIKVKKNPELQIHRSVSLP